MPNKLRGLNSRGQSRSTADHPSEGEKPTVCWCRIISKENCSTTTDTTAGIGCQCICFYRVMPWISPIWKLYVLNGKVIFHTLVSVNTVHRILKGCDHNCRMDLSMCSLYCYYISNTEWEDWGQRVTSCPLLLDLLLTCVNHSFIHHGHHSSLVVIQLCFFAECKWPWGFGFWFVCFFTPNMKFWCK